MKKYFLIIFVFLFGFFVMPFVHAEEIPTEGVTYFLTYPNGDEDVVESYSMLKDIKEKLLYDGYTDSEGKVYLTGWAEQGKLRILQEVPDGYSTNLREARVDLSKANNFSFVNYKGLSNPQTSRSVIIVAIVLLVLGISFLVISKDKKKSLVIVPILLVMFGVYHANAWSKSFIISVNDGKGNPLSNVHVLVYGEPVIDPALAVKIDANGGTFLDGSTSMYFRLPKANCSMEEFTESLSDADYDYFTDNMYNAYRNGYNMIYPEIPEVLNNGSVLRLGWVESENADVVMIHGNGGTIDFYGKKLHDVAFYKEMFSTDSVRDFKNTGMYYVGVDNNANCSHYKKDGSLNDPNNDLHFREDEFREVYYICWNNKPDGIYINGDLFLGTVDSCYEGSEMLYSDDYMSLFNGYNTAFVNTAADTIEISYFKDNDSESLPDIDSDVITSVEIVKNGQTILTLNTSEMLFKGSYYQINNTNKNGVFIDYLDELYTKGCFEQ